MLNKEKGITLIALVITIIVLLILAGVSIAMLTGGQNGILTQASNASTATLRGEIEEAIKLGVSSVNTYLMTPSSVRSDDDPGYTELSYPNIADEINKSYGSSTSGTATAVATADGINYTTGGKTYKVTFTINNTTRSISDLSVDMDNPTDAT